VDLFLSFWGPTEIAHTIISWEFDDGRPLAISIETRKAKGESYSTLRGFFRQYELYYVVADERDLVGLRTNYRGEQVYLYRIRIPIQQARALLIDYLTKVNRLADHPQWYNALLTISEVAATSPKKPGPLATFPTFPIAFATDFQKHERNCSRDKKRHPQMEPSVD
jgi:hypothetical protein